MLEGLRAIDLVNLDLKKSTSFVGGSASLFIDEGDGFTGERERVWMLLSLVAHTDEDSDDGRRLQYCRCYYRMSGAHGRLRYLLQEG